MFNHLCECGSIFSRARPAKSFWLQEPHNYQALSFLRESIIEGIKDFMVRVIPQVAQDAKNSCQCSALIVGP